MHKRFSFISCVAVLLFGISASAQAQSLYAGVLGGYAVTTDDQYGIEPYGLGLGLSAGVTLPVLPIYAGARVVWHVGESGSIGPSGARLELDSNYLLYGVDLGLDLEVGPVVLRPGFGLGRAVLENSGSAVGVTISDTDASLYFAPGLGLILQSGLLYFGAELRYNGLTEGDHADSVSMLASFGVHLG